MQVADHFSHISRAHISKRRMYFNVKSLAYYFHVKANILADFQICISVPLISWSKTKIFIDHNDKIWTKNSEIYVSFMCFCSVKYFNNFGFT